MSDHRVPRVTRRRLLAAVAWGGALATLGACSAAGGGLGPDGPGRASERNDQRGQYMSSRTVTYADNGTTITLRPGEQVVIRLPEQPTTGFRWAVDQSEAALVALVATTYVPTAGAGVGGEGEQVWTFEARHPGTGQLRLKRWRAWEGDPSVQERFAVRIQVLP